MGFVYMRHHRICVLSRLCFSAFNKQSCVACMYVCMCPLRLSACVCETAAGMCILVPAHCLRVRAEAALYVRVCVCAHVFFVTGMWWWWCCPQKIKVDQGYVCLCLWVCVCLLQGMKDSLVSTEINIACVQASKVRLGVKGSVGTHIYSSVGQTLRVCMCECHIYQRLQPSAHT